MSIVINFTIFAFCILFAFSSFFISNNEIDLLNIFSPISAQHFLGTDFLGKDVFIELIHASFASLSIGFLSASLSCFIGLVVGIFMQFYFKDTISKILDLLIATPSLIVIMFIQSIFDGDKWVIICLFGFTHFALISKSLNIFFINFLKQDYLQNLIIFKCSKLDVLKHVSILLFGILFTLFIQNMAHIILSESTLSFFGLGLKPFEPSLGNMLNDNTKSIYLGYYHLILAPGIYLFLLIYSLSNLSNFFKRVYIDRY